MNTLALDAHLDREAGKHYEQEEVVTVWNLAQQYFDERMDALSSEDILGGLQWASEAHCQDIRESFKDDEKLARHIRAFIRNYVRDECISQAEKELASHH
jgi:hypothetical protein